MNCEPSVSPATETSYDRRLHKSLCWGAVLAGTITAFGIHWLLTTLGIGAGLTIFGPPTDSDSITTFSAGTALICGLFAIIALSFGGWMAGRLSGCRRSGVLHGVLVWCLTLIIALPWLALATGLALGRAVKNQNENVHTSRQAATVAEADLARTAAQRCHDQLGSFVEEAVQSIPTNATPKADTRAEREVGFAVNKLFAPGNAGAFQANRLETLNALMVYTEMTAADATTTIDAWITSEKNLQAELAKLKAELNNHNAMMEQAARSNTEALYLQKTQVLSRLGGWSFFSLLIGLLGAASGGWCGAKCASGAANLPGADRKQV